MKGVVFDILRDMVETEHGLEGWNLLLERAGSDGMFLSTQSYADKELMALVQAASDVTGHSIETLLNQFGEFMVGEFYERYPSFFDDCDGLFEFLLSVDEIVHGEVLKFYPDAALPSFHYEQSSPEFLVMNYRSERKLCALAEGLIQGSAKHFKQSISLSHDPCMHKGSDHCRFGIQLNEVRND